MNHLGTAFANLTLVTFLATSPIFVSCNEPSRAGSIESVQKTAPMGKEMITLGAGCFWCVEAIFEQLKGVEKVESGYSGGSVKNPSYKAVCSGTTGHAEVCQLTYDPEVTSVKEILEVFFQTHDPTTLNRQGADVGTQYRSAIYYHTDEQRDLSNKVIAELNEAGVWSNPIVTEVTAYETFYVAEDYHQEYFVNNGDQPYCRAVIQPKVEKFKKVFADKLK